MLTEARLIEIETSPRDAYILKAEAKELADAYRSSAAGLTVTTGADGVWLHIESPSGKRASLSMEAIGIQRKGICGAAILEWVDARVLAQPPRSRP